MKIFFLFLIGELRVLRDKWVVARISSKARNVRIDSRVVVTIGPRSDFFLSDGVSIGHGGIIIVDSDRKEPCTKKSTLSIGRDTFIGERCNIRAAGVVTIGERCLIAQNVSIIGSNYKMDASSRISEAEWDKENMGLVIGDDVWIGANCTILPGVSIGHGAIIGAGCVISRDVSPMSIVVGNKKRTVWNRQAIT